MRTLLFFVTISACLSGFAQGWMPQGARSAGIGNASVALSDLFAFHHNPGAIGFLEQGGAAVSYENRYLLRELQQQSFVVAQPLKTGVVSIGGQFYGYENFRTTRIGAGYSLQLTDNFSAGVQLNYLNLRLDPFYGVRHAVTAEVGGLLKIDEKLSLGFAVFNIGRARLAEFEDDRFSTIMRLGAFYQLSEHLAFAVEIGKDITYATRLRTGIEYNPTDRFYFRTGVQTAPVELSGGFGVKFDQFMLDFGTHFHQSLGWTPGVSLLYNFAKK